MLYDLVFDPQEADNLVECSQLAGVLEEMRSRLDRWMRETGDPLLAGRAPVRLGIIVNDPDGLSPREPRQVIGG